MVLVSMTTLWLQFDKVPHHWACRTGLTNSDEEFLHSRESVL
jgi:hypothetical protein